MKFPGATYRPLAFKQTQPQLKNPNIIIVHTMVGYLTSTDTMFHQNGYGGTESHFGIGGKWGGDAASGYDGRVFQWVDTAFTADANLDANHRAISIETADNAPRAIEDIQGWTPKQLNALVDVIAWACKTYDIPPVLVPDSKSNRTGIGYHRLGCEHSDGLGSHPGWLVAGGERWSTSRGKGCPGPARIAQLANIVVPAVQVRLNGQKPIQEEDVMATKEEVAKEVWGYVRELTAADAAAIGDPKLEGTESSMNTLVRFSPAVARLRRELDARMDKLEAQNTEIIRLLGTLVPSPVPPTQEKKS